MSATIVNANNVEWTKIESLTGVSGKLLAYDKETNSHAFLVEYEPGTEFPRHSHPSLEHVYILAGEVETEGQIHGAGTHLIFPAGHEHGPFYNKAPLTELVVFQGPSGLEDMPEIKTLLAGLGIL